VTKVSTGEKQLRRLVREALTGDDFRDVYRTAQMAHTGQSRRTGEPYFTHPSEVRNIVTRFYPRDRVAQLAALLHDTLEDAPGNTVRDVAEMETFIRGSIADSATSAEVLRVVRLLTHTGTGDYAAYVTGLRSEPTALRVKLSDMLHNLRSSPSDRQRAKYSRALDHLDPKDAGPPAGISRGHWLELLDLAANE
jgi:(p)ppGpp synthase/HD superfamily hydrolase